MKRCAVKDAAFRQTIATPCKQEHSVAEQVLQAVKLKCIKEYK